MPSPLQGADGNREFFLYCRKDAVTPLRDDGLDVAVDAAYDDARAGS
jgi:hypothetical protein